MNEIFDFSSLYRDFYYLDRPKDGYLFVVTYGRSGSTLTQLYLNSLKGYLIRGENGNILSYLAKAVSVVFDEPMFSSRREEWILPREHRSAYLQPILGEVFDPWYGAEFVNPDYFALRIFDAFVRDVLRPSSDVRILGFKEIRWTEDLRFFSNFLIIIEKYFKSARFIFQTRDWRAVSRSGWWKDQDPQKVKDFVTRSDQAFANFAKDRENCLEIRYEDFDKNLYAFRQISDFLGEQFREEVASKVYHTQLMHGK